MSDYAVRNLGTCYDCGKSRCECEDEIDAATCRYCGDEFRAEGDFCSRGCEAAHEMHQDQRETNLQRWGLRPKGVNIEIRRKVA